MYTALYRTERPEVFSEILGQEHIVKILKNQINTNTVSHAYLFCGTRGTGKTTTARLLAKAVNCTSEGQRPCGECENCQAIKEGRFMDVIEIDAASNNGVENIRELRESVKYPPSVGRKKVYIIDEVHMLSGGAFNALLKTLEEPPEDVMFILATTEPQKLPATILSRCMRLDFKRVPEEIIMGGMKKICQARGINIDDGALKLLATNADGSVRDGLSILDQCLSTGEQEITRDIILEFLGTVGDEFFIELTDRVMLHQVSEALLLLNNVIGQGKDVKQLIKDWNAHYRNLLITKFVKNPEDMLNMSRENIERLRAQSQQITLDEIDHAIICLSKTSNEARWSTQPRILLEMAMVQIATNLIDEAAVVKTRPNVAPMNQYVQPPKNVTAAAVEPGPSEENQGKPAAQEGKKPQMVKATPSATTEVDCDAVWQKVFEKGEGTQGSFNLLRTGAALQTITDKAFVVSCSSGFIMSYVEENKFILERLLREITGQNLKLEYRVGKAEATVQADEKSDVATAVESVLGIKVEIE